MIPQGYKQTEVGVIPEDWGLRTVGELVEQTSPICYGVVQVGRHTNDGIPIVAIKFVKEIAHAPLHRTDASLERPYARSRPKVGDVLISIKGTIGRVGIVPSGFEGNISRELARLRISGDTYAEYVAHQLEADATQERIMRAVVGTTRLEFSIASLRRFLLPVPSTREEQQAIAEALSDVDAQMGALDRLITKKRDLKQAAMQQLLTGQTRLPGFTGEWEIRRLGDAGKCIRGVSYQGDSDLSTHDTFNTRRLLRSNNVQDAVVVTDEVQFVNAERVSSHQLLNRGDILVCMANGSKALVGKAGLFNVSDGYEYTFGAFMGCFRTNAIEANPTFVFYLFQTNRYRDFINNLLAGSSINNLRPSSVESLEFSMPPLLEQTEIAAVLAAMDGEISCLEQRRTKTRAFKQAMMQELLTGKTRLI